MKLPNCSHWLSLIVCIASVMRLKGEHVYLNQFGVHIEGGLEQANKVATETGMINLGQIGSLSDHYVFEIPNREKRSAFISQDHHTALNAHGKVRWFEQQRHLSRSKRDFQPTQETITLVDPLWHKQWYLQGGGYGGYDMNVTTAWENGHTGRNVVITVLDDGIERTHPDLQRNYDPYASYDVNDLDHNPTPRYDYSNANRHGTRCAGQISAQANNSYCVAGIAPESRIGGVRMLDGSVTDAVEAASLSFNRSHIDIYSSSWGPDDDGRTLEGPSTLAARAFKEGIQLGRGGKGSIFIWASGNGGRAYDSCNCDGYSNSIYTLSISSTSQQGRKPWYLEECSSTLATTYSSGAYGDGAIVTTDLRHRCTITHTGTSASAPMAAGIVALALGANANLTWRDVQYIAVMTSRPEPLQDGNWEINGVGKKVSLRYGYGLMDASAMVDLALKWITLPIKQECHIHSNSSTQSLQANQKLTLQIDADGCNGTATEVNFLEHVQAKVYLSYEYRGDVEIFLTSPSGTRSQLLTRRPRDIIQTSIDGWPFLSVHFWGENPTGIWTLEVKGGNRARYNAKGQFLAWSLILHGTKTQPDSLKDESNEPPTSAPVATSSDHVPTSTLPTATQELETDSSPSNGPLPTDSTNEPFINTTAEQCHEECRGGCYEVNSPTECFECQHFQIETSRECVHDCPPGTAPLEHVCHPCHFTCATCNGTDINDCLSCHDNLLYDATQHVCAYKCSNTDYASHEMEQFFEKYRLLINSTINDLSSALNCSVCERKDSTGSTNGQNASTIAVYFDEAWDRIDKDLVLQHLYTLLKRNFLDLDHTYPSDYNNSNTSGVGNTLK